MFGPSWSITLIYFAGMLATFVGERIMSAGPGRWLTAVGVLGVVAALALRGLRSSKVAPERRGVERMLLGLYGIGALALVLYFVQSDLAAYVFGHPLERDWPKLATVLEALWPAVWLFSALPVVMTEFSYAAVTRAPRLELARIRDAMWSGVGLAGALVFAFAIAYVGAERDKKVDLSYFRTARPGESTRKIIRTMDQPVQVSLFFPPSNEVKEQVVSYFDDLKKESKLLEVSFYDRDVDVQKAKELGVSVNGTVVVARGSHKEPLTVGLELEGARAQLRNLDRDVQTRLLKIARPPRTVYFVTGHGEKGFEATGPDGDHKPTLRTMREMLQQQTYTVRTLGVAEGLAQDVPADATVVALIGPTKPLSPEESAALVRYFDRGGRLFVALEPDSNLDAHELLGPLGLKLFPQTLCSDQVFARKTNQPSDHANIATGTFTSHPSVTMLGRYGGRAPLIFVGAGHIEETKDKPAGVSVDPTVKSHGSDWADTNGNFTFDPPAEQRKQYMLAAAVTKKAKDKDKKDEGRAIVVADSDFISDGVIDLYGNPAFVLDGMKWLVGDEAITGEISNENDVPIVHTKKQDNVWFYGSAFLAPALVLGIGALATRRRGRAIRKENHS